MWTARRGFWRCFPLDFSWKLLRQDDHTFLNHAAMLVMSNKYTPSTSFMLDFLHFQGIGWLSLLPQIHVLVLEHHPLVGRFPGPSLEAHIGSGVFQMGRRQCHTKAHRSRDQQCGAYY